MKLRTEAVLLRIFIGENDRYQGQPLYHAIVKRARNEGLAGATVLRGMLGFGANSFIHSAKILRLSEDLPMVIEIVDEPERIQAFTVILDEMIGEGLVTLERIQVVMYRTNGQEQ